MLVFACRAKYVNTIRHPPNQLRTLEIVEANIKCCKAKEAMKQERTYTKEDVSQDLFKELISATKVLKKLHKEHKDLALKKREGKKPIKETKLKFKETLKKLHVEKLEETRDHPIKIKQLKDLSSELKTAVDIFRELDGSELPESWTETSSSIDCPLLSYFLSAVLEHIRCQQPNLPVDYRR